MTEEKINYDAEILKRTMAIPQTPSALKLKPLKPPLGNDAQNIFNNLPKPGPGDRIKSSDFKQLSDCLELIREAYDLSASHYGQDFGKVKLALAYRIQGVMSVFGTEITDFLNDGSLDTRKVIQILPSQLGGGNGVIVILTESIETRRFVPNLVDKPHTHKDALEMIATAVGEATLQRTIITTPSLEGLSWKEATTMF